MVSIAAFQAVDPGSIPGRRRTFSYNFYGEASKNKLKIFPLPGIEYIFRNVKMVYFLLVGGGRK